MKNIIVTGATSMLGVALIEEAVKSEETEIIYAVVQPMTKKLHRIPESNKIKIVECDARRYYELDHLIHEKCNIFYHVAWIATGRLRNQDIMLQVENIKCSINAIRVAHKLQCEKFIGTGSQAEYGVGNNEKISPMSIVNPIQAYGIAKYAVGKLVLEEAKSLNMEAFWVRVFSVYGKYDKDTTMIASSVRKMLNNEPTCYTSSEQMWDYLFSSDAGRALYMIGEQAIGRKVYCLGSGVARPLYEYIYQMKDNLNYKLDLGIGKIENSPNTVKYLCADITDLTKDTGWIPEVDFSEGIKIYLDHIKYCSL